MSLTPRAWTSPPLRKSAIKSSRAPIKRKSAKQAAKDREWGKVTAVRLGETRGICERCSSSREQLSGHHKLPRSQGGLNVRDNCAVLCSKCHSYIHENPDIGYSGRWLLHPWDASPSIGGTMPRDSLTPRRTVKHGE